MPLLRKEPFEKAPIPAHLTPDDEIFYVALTEEIFTDYDEFFKRTILLNSLVWTCGATGRSGLTYEEALNSEKAAQGSLEVFPDNLERPLMFLASLTCRGRVDDMVFDIWSFCKERYLISEIVEVCYNGSKSFAQILSVKHVGNDKFKSGRSAAGTSVGGDDDIMDGQEEQDEVYASGRRKPKADYRAPPASDYVYVLAILPKRNLDDMTSLDPDSPLLGSYPKAELTPQEILRRRHLFTKQKCRIFVKSVCEPRNGFWVVKEAAFREYNLDRMDWSRDVFGGPLPIFRRTPASRRSVLAPANEEPQASSSTGRKHQQESTSTKSKHKRAPSPSPVMTEQQLKLRQMVEKQQLALASLIDECNRYNIIGGGKQLTMDDFPLDSTDVELNEQILAELRERAKKAKDEEKERGREMKRREKEALIEWRKPKDDLQCDDHLPLPELPPIRCPPFLSIEYFGDVLALLEFLTSFAEELNLKEYFPVTFDGGIHVTLAMLYDALKTKAIDHVDNENGITENGKSSQETGAGTLTKLFKALLDQVFRRLAEEDGDEANLDNREELQHENCDLDHPFYGKIIEEATRASEGVRNTHGMSIRHLPMDSITLTELLRLHLAASGYYPGSNPGRFRYQSRGGYRCWDDPGMTFRTRNPELMEKLGRCTIFELDPVSRLKLLTVLSNQLLTFSTMRFPLQQKTERLQALRYEIRQLQLNDQKHDREAMTAKICKQEARAATVLEHGELNDDQKYDPEKPSSFVQRLRKYLPKSLPKNDNGEQSGEITWESIDEANQEKIKALIKDVDYEGVALEEVDDIREVQRQIFFHDERRLVEEIYRLQTACGMVILGRDRAYRKYNLLASLGAIVVERFDRTIGECADEEGTPIDRVEGIAAIRSDSRRVLLTKQQLLVCTGMVETCPVHDAFWTSDEWYLIQTREALDQLTAALNRRGFRESELLENLEFFRPFIERAFDQCPTDLLLRPVDEANGSVGEPEQVTEYCEETLKDAMLDFEERLAGGNFGGLRGRVREQWRQTIEKNSVVQAHPEIRNIDDNVGLKIDLGADNVDAQDSAANAMKIRAYSKHLLDLASAIHLKAYRKAFVEPHGRYVEGEFIETGTNSLQLWKSALSSVTSYAQLHLHVATLDSAITWNKSTTQMKCRLCRRKGDVQTFLECDVCERLYHSACLKSPATTIPDPVTRRWSCPDCVPKTLPKVSGAIGKKGDYDDDDGMDDEDEDYCESCQTSLKGAKRRFTCSSCSAVYHPSCAVPSGSSKWTKADISRWKCENCTGDEVSTPVSVHDRVTPAMSRQRSAIFNDSDTGSDFGQNSPPLDHREVSKRLLAATSVDSIKSTRTGRVVKKPKSFEEIEADPSKSPKKKPVFTTSNGSHSSPAVSLKTYIPGSSAVSGIFKSPATPTGKTENWKAIALQLLQELSSHVDAWPFQKPVTKKIAPDYFTIIKTPMDLSTVRTKAYKDAYGSPAEFVADLELIFENCRLYNVPAAPVYQSGVRLESFMKQRLAEMLPGVSGKAASRKQSLDNGTAPDLMRNGDSGHDTRKRIKRMF